MSPNIHYNLIHLTQSQDSDVEIDTSKHLSSSILLDSERRHAIGRRVWNKIQEESLSREEPDLLGPQSEILDGLTQQSLEESLSSIRILKDRDQNQEWLDAYNAELYDIPLHLVQQVRERAPSTFGGRVADFNDNLLFQFQSQEGLSQMGLADNDYLQQILKTKEYLGSYLTTETTIPQPAHVDYTWEVLEEQGDGLFVAFFPLTTEGMFLQVWPRNDDETEAPTIAGELVFIPYGSLLVVPACTIHGGGFRTTPRYGQDSDSSHGNIRFHFYLARKSGDDSRSKLPTHQTNKYTEPRDKRRELCERYVDASHMKTLQQYLFV